MNGNEIMDALEGVDEKLISRAENSRGRSPLPYIIGACAAALVFAGAMLLLFRPVKPEAEAALTEPSETAEHEDKEAAVNTPAPVSEDSEGSYIIIASYKGRLYEAQGCALYELGVEDEFISNKAVSPKHWREPDESVEFLADFAGEYYTVKGVDPRFMICAKGADRHGINGEDSLILINTCGECFENGRDLIENALHVSETDLTLTFESFDSWNNSKHEIFELDPAHREAAAEFVSALDESEWAPFDSIYNLPRLWHINFKLNCGIGVDMMICRGGRVWVTGMNDRVLNVGEEAAEKLMRLLGDPQNSVFVGRFPGAEYSLAELRAIPELGAFVPDAPEGFHYMGSTVGHDTDPDGGCAEISFVEVSFDSDSGYRGITVYTADEEHIKLVDRYYNKLVYEPGEVTEERLLEDAGPCGLFFSVRFDGYFVLFDTSLDCAGECASMIAGMR